MDSLRAADKESTAPYPRVALRVAEATPVDYGTSSANAALTIEASHFVNVRSDPERRAFTWGALVDVLSHPRLERPSKAECRLLSLVTFGDKRTHGTSGSLRNKANVLKCYGAMGDYDAGEVSPAEAAARLEAHGIEAFIYTSPSHTAERPRWRAIAPFSGPLAPAEYQALMDRLNGALGGILGAESWDVSRCYYVGKVRGAPYETHHVRGTCIDLVDGIEPIGKPRNKRDREKRAQAESTDSAEILHEISDEQLADLRSALSYEPLLRAAGAYELWNEINLALLSLGDVGEELIREYSAAADNYDPEGVEAWIERNRSTVPRSDFRHVFALAAERGWENPIAETRVADPADFEAKEAPSNFDADAEFEHHLAAAKCAMGEDESEPREALEEEFVLPQWCVKGVLQKCGIAAMFAPPNEGKTTVAVSLGCHVALGHEWCGRKVKQGTVIYVANEDRAGVRARLEAFAQQNGIKKLPFYIETSVNLLEKASVLRLARRFAKHRGRIALMVFDTLAASAAEANENTSEIGPAVANMRALATFFDCTVLYTHHTGKDVTRGQRGWSGLRGAVDTELEIDNGAIEIVKQRNGRRGDRFGFVLAEVCVGLDEDGDPVTVCAVEYTEAPERRPRTGGSGRKLSGVQKTIYETACDLASLDERRVGDVAKLLDAVVDQLAKDPQRKGDPRRGNVRRSLDRMGDWLEVFDDGSKYRVVA